MTEAAGDGFVDSPLSQDSTEEKSRKVKILEDVIEIVGQRGLNYGTPEDNFARIARRWNVHLDNLGLTLRDENGAHKRLTEIDVAQMMIDMKLARLENEPGHQDSWADTAGYAACGAEIAERQRVARVGRPVPAGLMRAVEAALAPSVETPWRGDELDELKIRITGKKVKCSSGETARVLNVGQDGYAFLYDGASKWWHEKAWDMVPIDEEPETDIPEHTRSWVDAAKDDLEMSSADPLTDADVGGPVAMKSGKIVKLKAIDGRLGCVCDGKYTWWEGLSVLRRARRFYGLNVGI